MYKILLTLTLLFFFNGCSQQTRALSPNTQNASAYSLEALDVRYHQDR